MKRVHRWIAVFVLAGAGLAATRARAPEKTKSAAALASASASTATAAPSVRATVGERREHAIGLVKVIDVRPPNGGAGDTIRLAIDGSWTTTRLSTDVIEVVLRAERVSFMAGGHETKDRAAKAAFVDGLSAPFYASIARSGKVGELWFRRGIDELARGTLKSILASTQITGARGAATWSEEESDTTGEYVASYKRTGERSFEKSRVRYLRIATARGMLPVEKVGAFTGKIESVFGVDERGAMTSLASKDQLRVDSGKDMPIVLTTSDLSISLRNVGVDRSRVGSEAPADYEQTDLSGRDGLRDTAARQDEQLLAGATFETLDASLAKLSGHGEAGRERALVHARLEALFRRTPGTAAQAAARIEAGVAPDTARTLIGALGGAGTAEAQAALARLSSSASMPSELRTNAIASLGLTQEPTPDTVAALEQATSDPSRDVQRTAALALGSTARSLATSDRADEASEPIDHLLGLLDDAKTPDAQAIALRALGNTGDARAEPAIEAALTSPDAVVRSAAVVALRFLPGADVDRRIAAALDGDASTEVRESAVFAASFRARSAELVPALRWSAEHDASESVRRAASALLARS